jgi:hypothetical protein
MVVFLTNGGKPVINEKGEETMIVKVLGMG